MRLKHAVSFNDVMLVPRLSKLNTRGEADLSTTIAGVPLRIPIIAANMSSVCEEQMAITLGEMGGLGIIHRMCSVDEQANMVDRAHNRHHFVCNSNHPWSDLQVGFSIGVGHDWRDRMDACKGHAVIACLDVAHAHHQRVLDLLDKYFGIYKDYPIIIGQVATPSAVWDILKVIPERHHKTVAFKTSIGGGSLCTTRIKTGFGVPTLQAVMDISAGCADVSLIADGGIRESGDIVKSLAAGSNAVMLGNLLAGTDEAPGRLIKGRDGQLYKEYMGSASLAAKSLRGESRNIEGDSTLVAYKGSAKVVIQDLLDGIRSGFSYGGAENIQELQDNIEFIEITTAGYQESLPHGLL
jgi:IMP dehydrogenase